MDWVISIKDWGNGYTELRAENADGDSVFGKDIKELKEKISERYN